MDEVETEFLEAQERTPLVWFRHIDDFYFVLACSGLAQYDQVGALLSVALTMLR